MFWCIEVFVDTRNRKYKFDSQYVTLIQKQSEQRHSFICSLSAFETNKFFIYYLLDFACMQLNILLNKNHNFSKDKINSSKKILSCIEKKNWLKNKSVYFQKLVLRIVKPRILKKSEFTSQEKKKKKERTGKELWFVDKLEVHFCWLIKEWEKRKNRMNRSHPENGLT